MAKKMEVTHIGIVENMSGLICPNCGEEIALFGSGGAERQAKELEVEFLGRIPIDIEVRQGGDEGRPIILTSERALVSQAFFELASRIDTILSRSGSAAA